MPTFNPQVTRYADGLRQGMTEAGRAIGQGMQKSRESEEAKAINQRNFEQQKELVRLQQGNDVQTMAIGYGQKAALQSQEWNERKTLQDRSWSREASEKQTTDTEKVGYYEAKFNALSAEIPVTQEDREKFVSGNKGTKQAMAESLEMEYQRRLKQKEEEEKLRRESGTLEAIPVKDANGNIVGSQMVKQTPNGAKVYGWMPNQQTDAPMTPPPGMVPKSFNNKTGTTIYGQPQDGTVNVLEQPPEETNRNRQDALKFFGN